MTRRALITGVNGFVGPYLAQALHEAGWAVAGTHYGPTLEHPLPLPDGTELAALDIRRLEDVVACLARIRPEGIVHLAGFSEPSKSVSNPLLTSEINVMGTLHVLEAMKRAAPSARCVVVGSGDVYGNQRPGDPPFTEVSPLAPRNPYAVTKAAADWMAGHYASTPHHLDVVRVRPFNHTGAGQQRGLVCPDFAYGVAAIADRGERRGELAVGNLDSAKDFTDVRDIARAYVLALEHGERGVAYNLCSGRTTRVREILEILERVAGIEVRPVANPELAGSPTSEVRASAARFSALTGWRPEIPFEQTLRELYEHCRGVVARARTRAS